MSDSQNLDSTTRQVDDLVDTVGRLGGSIVRIGVAAVAWPLYLLPARTRSEAIGASGDLVNAVGALHLSLVKGVVSGLNVAAHELDKATSQAVANR